MKALLLILLGLGLSWPAGAADFARLSRQMAATDRFKASFTQVSYNALKDRAVTLTGWLAWMRPGLMRFEYEQPEPLSVIVGQDRVWIYDPLLENVTLADKSEVDRLAGLAFLFAGRPLSELYQPLAKANYSAQGAKDPGWIYLKPKSATPGLAELHVKPGKALVEAFVLFDGQGNWRRFELKGLQTKPSLNAQDFHFEIPEGMEVIDKLTVEH